jgi:hypothetical protein
MSTKEREDRIRIVVVSVVRSSCPWGMRRGVLLIVVTLFLCATRCVAATVFCLSNYTPSLIATKYKALSSIDQTNSVYVLL